MRAIQNRVKRSNTCLLKEAKKEEIETRPKTIFEEGLAKNLQNKQVNKRLMQNTKSWAKENLNLPPKL